MGRVLSLAVAFAVTGCGTVANLSGPTDAEPPLEVYGGVSQSYGSLKQAFIDPEAVVLSPLLVPDVVLSAVGDTLTLPITLAAKINRSIAAYYSSEELPVPDEWRKFWFDESQSPASTPPAATGAGRVEGTGSGNAPPR